MEKVENKPPIPNQQDSGLTPERVAFLNAKFEDENGNYKGAKKTESPSPDGTPKAIADRENMMASDIKSWDNLRAKKGLGPATDAEIKDRFSTNLGSLRQLKVLNVDVKPKEEEPAASTDQKLDQPEVVNDQAKSKGTLNFEAVAEKVGDTKIGQEPETSPNLDTKPKAHTIIENVVLPKNITEIRTQKPEATPESDSKVEAKPDQETESPVAEVIAEKPTQTIGQELPKEVSTSAQEENVNQTPARSEVDKAELIVDSEKPSTTENPTPSPDTTAPEKVSPVSEAIQDPLTTIKDKLKKLSDVDQVKEITANALKQSGELSTTEQPATETKPSIEVRQQSSDSEVEKPPVPNNKTLDTVTTETEPTVVDTQKVDGPQQEKATAPDTVSPTPEAREEVEKFEEKTRMAFANLVDSQDRFLSILSQREQEGLNDLMADSASRYFNSLKELSENPSLDEENLDRLRKMTDAMESLGITHDSKFIEDEESVRALGHSLQDMQETLVDFGESLKSQYQEKSEPFIAELISLIDRTSEAEDRIKKRRDILLGYYDRH